MEMRISLDARVDVGLSGDIITIYDGASSYSTNIRTDLVSWSHIATGSPVRVAQYMLNSPYNGSHGLVTDGQFGTNTDTAIRKFQTANGLSSDGIVGYNTWIRMWNNIPFIK